MTQSSGSTSTLCQRERLDAYDKAVFARVLLVLTMQIHEPFDCVERLSTNQAANGLKHLKRFW
jgi:hypothetical protein